MPFALSSIGRLTTIYHTFDNSAGVWEVELEILCWPCEAGKRAQRRAEHSPSLPRPAARGPSSHVDSALFYYDGVKVGEDKTRQWPSHVIFFHVCSTLSLLRWWPAPRWFFFARPETESRSELKSSGCVAALSVCDADDSPFSFSKALALIIWWNTCAYLRVSHFVRPSVDLISKALSYLGQRTRIDRKCSVVVLDFDGRLSVF